ncbi:hypothetical protein [Bacillus mesophilum]|uniref:Uncharacterized protein n=1 Tax=Bacillus mesophilum TaxID=1071718 RepID=A0A7V7RM07_9BACI|nr:hypothetical protein [Bacillus mesophilum]KAB2332936.1 hypothetical protein F7732_12710 [Bacillus mesophilum]
MTLVMNYGVSGLFAISASDSRRVTKNYLYDEATGEFTESDLPPTMDDEKYTKSSRLSYFTLLSIGGIAELGEYIKDELTKEVSVEYDIKDCKDALERVIARARENKDGPEWLNFLDKADSVKIVIIGFCKDTKKVGQVSFVPEDGVSLTLPEAGTGIWSIMPPVKKYHEAGSKLMNVPFTEEDIANKTPDETSRYMRQKVLNHLAGLHGMISYFHPFEVSSDINAHVLALEESGKIEWYFYEEDLEKLHDLYRKPREESEC